MCAAWGSWDDSSADAAVAMFSLIYGFVQHVCKQDEFHVLILGLDKAGKTNVLEKLKTLLSDLNGKQS